MLCCDTKGSVGAVCVKLLERMGIPSADIVTSTFDAYADDCYIPTIGPTKIIDVLHKCMRSGFFLIVPRADGKIVAVPERPQNFDNGVIIRDYQIVGDRGWRLRTETIGTAVALPNASTMRWASGICGLATDSATQRGSKLRIADRSASASKRSTTSSFVSCPRSRTAAASDPIPTL